MAMNKTQIDQFYFYVMNNDKAYHSDTHPMWPSLYTDGSFTLIVELLTTYKVLLARDHNGSIQRIHRYYTIVIKPTIIPWAFFL